MSFTIASMSHLFAVSPLAVAGVLIRIVLVSAIVVSMLDLFRQPAPVPTLLRHNDWQHPPRKAVKAR
jgi:hypothetical protein